MKKRTPAWQRKLTKDQLTHLKVDAGCDSYNDVRFTLHAHALERKKNGNDPQKEPCWRCRDIARALGLTEVAS